MQNTTLPIHHQSWEHICQWAEQSSPDECVGLMFRNRHPPHMVNRAVLLAAQTSPSHALVEPAVLAEVITSELKNGFYPAGVWHSHGTHPVYHSATDDEMLHTILPGFGDWGGFKQVNHEHASPVLVDHETAWLPLPSGQRRRFTLQGQPVPGGVGTAMLTWETVNTQFLHQELAPRAILTEKVIEELNASLPENQRYDFDFDHLKKSTN